MITLSFSNLTTKLQYIVLILIFEQVQYCIDFEQVQQYFTSKPMKRTVNTPMYFTLRIHPTLTPQNARVLYQGTVYRSHCLNTVCFN